MKKKKIYKILSFLFCFMFLFFVGCDGGPGGLGDETNPRSLDGTKVLSKPMDYDFSVAVGSKASANYYNIFAREVLYNLYSIYEDISYKTALKNYLFDNIDTTQGITYTENLEEKDYRYYLYDSLRYSISDVTRNADGQITISFYDDTAWKWTIDSYATNYKTFFEKLTEVNSLYFKFENGKFVITTKAFEDREFMSWLDYCKSEDYNIYFPSFVEIYSYKSGDDTYNIQNEVKQYAYSPYFQQVVEGKTGEEVDAKNYLQDALEYAIYLFVLGYDYVDKDGNATADAPLFDFELVTNADGEITNIKVKGWETNSIDIVDALGRVKALYQELGGYVGITETNQKQIIRFVKDKIIGASAMTRNIFTVGQKEITQETRITQEGDNAGTQITHSQDEFGNDVTTKVETSLDSVYGKTIITTTKTSQLVFNRNYETIIANIVAYACEQAPIGFDLEKNESVYLNKPYMASKISEYPGDYFFMSYDNDDDSEMFKYIAPAEYQSMILYPQTEDLGKPLTDIWLAFEYNNDYGSDKVFLDELVVNIGFRYYDSTIGEYTYNVEGQKKIKYGKNGEIAGTDPDVNWFYICDFQDVADVLLDKEIVVKEKFNTNIGGGVINPFVSGTTIGFNYAEKLISGEDKSREYYNLNDSSSYGVFGTLNGEKFNKNDPSVGENGCDFMEIYFDVVKQKGVSGVNYNFKVGLVGFFMEDV